MDLNAREFEVAERVECFMANKLVWVPKAFRVQDERAIQNDRIRERTSENEAHLLQRFNIAKETEGAGGGNLVKGSFSVDVMEFLKADRRVVPIDGGMNFEAIRGFDDGPFFREFYFHAALDRERGAGSGLELHARAFQSDTKRSGAAVENRNFRPLNFDEQVIDAEAMKGGHQVFNRRNRGGSFSERSRHLRVHDIPEICFDWEGAREVNALKKNALIHARRLQRNAGFFAVVQSNALKGHRFLNRSLKVHKFALSSLSLINRKFNADLHRFLEFLNSFEEEPK